MTSSGQRPDKQDPREMTEPRTNVLNLEMNNAGLVCYIPVCGINAIASIVFLATEPKSNTFLRFHAWQSLLLSAAYVVFGIVISIVQGLLAASPLIQWLAFIPNVLWIVGTIGYIWKSIAMGLYAHKGGIDKLPIIGDLADRLC
jgi:uncharacterized membrane protein